MTLRFLVIYLTVTSPLCAASLDLGWGTTEFTVKDHFLFTNSKNSLDKETNASNTLLHEDYIHAEMRNYSAHIQFTNRYAFEEKNGSQVFTLEKKGITAFLGNWELKAGDNHQELGRGILLSLYKDDVFGLDNTLEGGHFKYSGEKVETNLFGGRIHSLKTPIALQPLENSIVGRTVALVGAQSKFSLTDQSRLGVQYLLTLNEPDVKTRTMGNGTFDKTWNGGGLSYEHSGIFENTDLYLESNLLIQQTLSEGRYYREDPGYGNYLSLSWIPSPWRFQWEIKDYRSFNYEFRRPPTLEVDLVETENENNITASRLYVENFNVESGTKIYTSYLVGEDWNDRVPLHHGIVGTQFKLGVLQTELKGGIREVPHHQQMQHGSLKLKIPTTEKQYTELNFQKIIKTKILGEVESEEDRNQVDLSYTFSKAWSWGVGYEYVPSRTTETGQHFVNTSTSLTLGSLSAKAFLGQTSGGTLCSGGVCRQRPPYTGGFLETTYQF